MTGRGVSAPLGDISRKMLDHRDAAAMGSIGPDLTFFLDLMPVAQVWLLRAKEIHDIIDRFVTAFNEAIGDVAGAVGAVVPGAQPLAQLFGDFGRTFDLIGGALTASLERWASNYIDGFAYLKLPMQQGLREEGWFWFDMLHYRRTSQFARHLYERANGDARLEAFAAGYVTHLAADVAGHAYVNACAGGAYRTQWQRHHCCDNYIDVWTLAQYRKGLDVGESHWDQYYPQTMDAAVRRQIASALRDTYTDVRHPDGRRLGGREWPTEDDIGRMYRTLREVIRWQTGNSSVKRPTVPACPVDFDRFPKHESFEETVNGERRVIPGSAWEWFKSLIKWVKDTVVFVAEVVKWVVDTVVSTALWPARYALYEIQSACYAIYRACRRVLALRGYCYAHPDELVGPPPAPTGLLGSLANALVATPDALAYDLERTYFMPGHSLEPGYPHLERLYITPTLASDAQRQAARAKPDVADMINACVAAGGFPAAFAAPWVYPASGAESERTLSSPYPNGSLPNMFIEEARFGGDIYALVKAVGSDPARMLQVSQQASRTHLNCLGNAVDLGRAMIADVVRDGSAPDFNLDGDRGYGWLCWDVEPIGGATRATTAFPKDQTIVGPRVGALRP